MKKLAILAALTLAIGASVTAGTMARYTQDLGEKDAVVSTKQFHITETVEDLNFDVKPGDSEKRSITLNTENVEVNMLLSFEISDLDETLIEAIEQAGGKFTLTNSATEEVIDIKANENGDFYVHQPIGSDVEEVEYIVHLDWSDHEGIRDSDITNAVQGRESKFKVRIVGTQS